MNVVSLTKVCRHHINHAGPRYTPGMDQAAPNLDIPVVLQAFEGLEFSDAFRARVGRLRDELLANWERCPPSAKRCLARRTNDPIRVACILEGLARLQPGDTASSVKALPTATRYLAGSLDTIVERLRAKKRQAEERRRLALSTDISELMRLRRSVAAIGSYARSPGFQLLTGNRLFLTGQWGTGKTHFLCDVASRRIEEDLPTLLVLASHLPMEANPLQALCRATGLAESPHVLFKNLQRLGERHHRRSLLLIDGINEADREVWRRSIGRIASMASRFPYVGLVVSCRTPFDEEILDESASKIYVQLEHHGFQDAEFDAQLEFFSYYEIPAPSLPLLAPEFSRPLFLKLLCESIKNLRRRDKKKYLREVTSGQKGMTHVLEHFVRRVGRSIEDEFGLSPMTCWRILKGASDQRGTGIAPTMAAELRDYVSREECVRMVQELSSIPGEAAEVIVNRMIEEGLLAERVIWKLGTTDSFEALQFPYQRFGDHLIARHLLDDLNTESAETIRRSFYRHRPLGKIFVLEEWGHQYSEPGLATALMLEFPERVKRTLADQSRELVDYLPRHCRTVAALQTPFLEGLYWRSSESFTRRTDELVELFLEEYDDRAANAALEVLFTLATRPTHPYSAERLSEYLGGFSMQQRDLVWSEFLRHTNDHSAVLRLIEWVERGDQPDLGPQTALNTVRLLSLTLTTTVRPLRDRVTRALFLLGLSHPGTLFGETQKCLGCNDPYVPERMLAASYGVAMSLWSDTSGQSLRMVLPEFARSLVRDMFLPSADHAAWHTLMQDYALGCIEIAQKLQPRCIATQYIRYIRRPFEHIPSPFVGIDRLDAEMLEQTESAIHMDFGNYTLGSLIPDRTNYDFEHSEYGTVRKQILGRMACLGYDVAKFHDVDRTIGNMHGSFGRNANGRKVDRYGKKYSWIAFFEMWGLRLDRRLLSDWRMEHRTAECDLDPSFPPAVPEWTPLLEQPFDRKYEDPIEWLADGGDPDYDHLLQRAEVDGVGGPWVLLDGYVSASAGDPRELFTFLRGLLVSPENIQALSDAVIGTPYPGNMRIPEVQDDHYTYAGEIPWSGRFGTYLRDDHGNAQRDLRTAFSQTEAIEVEVPAHRYAWESHHSQLNTTNSAFFAAPALCEALGLVNHAQELDLFDSMGRTATIHRQFDAGRGGRSYLLFIRKDLLEQYLTQTTQRLVWLVWGERGLNHEEFARYEDRAAATMRSYAHIHSRMLVHDFTP